jgi:hypothetical protein
LSWIVNFLTDRKIQESERKLRIDGRSEWGAARFGYYRSLMFLDFANELPGWIVNDMLMSADDTKLWARMNHVEYSLSLQMIRSQYWK